MLLAVLVCIGLIAVDQISKFYAASYLKPIDSFPVIPGIFDLTYVENDGMAFGMFRGGRWILVGLTVGVLIGLVIYFARLPREKKNRGIRFAMVLIMAGAVGNLIDRVRNGFVVDFFRTVFIDFPVFNVADTCVVVGTILLAVILLFFTKGETV